MRRLSVLFAVLALLLLPGAGTALADPPFRLAGRVADRAGALDPAATARVTQAIDRLRSDTGEDLFVVYVDSFDGMQTGDWADRTAQLSQLGRTDVLLAVATGDRAYHISYDQGFPLSQATTDEIANTDVEPKLAAGDWAGAAVALADALRAGRADGGGGTSWIGVGVVVAIVLVIAGVLFLRRRRKPRAAAPAPDEQESTDDLAYRASRALLDLDDAVRTSEQELTAARGHFGDAAAAGFAAALEQSRGEMMRAFTLRQRLDDDVPEDEAAKRDLLTRIVDLCRSADGRLDAQVAAFDRLRDLENRAPAYVDELAARLTDATARLPQVQAQEADLRTRWAAAALEPVAGNLDQARQLLDGARAATAAAHAALAGADGPDAGRAAAVVSGRAAEDALTQAGTLMDGIGRLGTEIAGAGERLAAARAETEQDLAEARTMLDGEDGELRALVARAQAALTAAAQAQQAVPPDPMAALRLVDEADRALDSGIAAARDAREQARRTAPALQQALLPARSAVAAGQDFVTTRRGAVGTAARTRLAEAQRHLGLA